MSLELDPYAQLDALGLRLPPLPPPAGNFVPAARHGDLLFLSGQGPRDPTTGLKRGKVGVDVSAEEAYEHAKLVGLTLLGVLHHELESLRRVRRIVKVLGMVNAVPEFAAHPQIVNGCSDLLVAVFGGLIGAHARSAIGVGSLPGNISIEIEAIVAVGD